MKNSQHTLRILTTTGLVLAVVTVAGALIAQGASNRSGITTETTEVTTAATNLPPAAAVAGATANQAAVATAATTMNEDKRIGDPYTLDTCPVSGEALYGKDAMGKPVVKIYDGREVRFCCNKCVKSFEKEPAKYWAEVDKQMIKQQANYYPMDTCLVSGDKLDDTGKSEMGKTIDFVYGNRLFRLCCEKCEAAISKNPEKYFKVLDDAVIARQTDAYPLSVCVVSDEKLGGDMGAPVDLVIANRLVRTCCHKCVKDVMADPQAIFKQIDDAAAAKKQGKN